MSDYSKAISLKPHKLGDRWIGATVGPATVNGATPSNNLVRVRMTFRSGPQEFVLDSRGGKGITITDAANWEASVDARDDFLPTAGKWQWDMEFYQATVEKPWTLYKGVLVVHSDV